MTNSLFIDTDCISAFLWVDQENIVTKLFPKQVVIPKQVYDELSHPGVNYLKPLKAQIDKLVAQGEATIQTIESDTSTYNLYRKLTSNPDSGHKIIGKGEAAAISLAKVNQGILASNNLKDISDYVDEYHLINITTGDILKLALDKGIISEEQGNILWGKMLARKRKLGFPSFSDFLKYKANIS